MSTLKKIQDHYTDKLMKSNIDWSDEEKKEFVYDIMSDAMDEVLSAIPKLKTGLKILSQIKVKE